jgi:subfamily B ATP-binding cassette protein HlyB/CyaB
VNAPDTTQASVTSSAADSGLLAFTLLLRFLDIAVDPQQLAHQFGVPFGTTAMLRCAKSLKIKARATQLSWQRLLKLQAPAIAERKDGSFLVVGKMFEHEVLISARIRSTM